MLAQGVFRAAPIVESAVRSWRRHRAFEHPASLPSQLLRCDRTRQVLTSTERLHVSISLPKIEPSIPRRLYTLPNTSNSRTRRPRKLMHAFASGPLTSHWPSSIKRGPCRYDFRLRFLNLTMQATSHSSHDLQCEPEMVSVV